jgi:hypothetical protein
MAIPYLYPTTFPYGARVVTFTYAGGGTGGHICEQFEVTENTTEVNRQDQSGAPNGFVLIAEPKSASATVQLAGSSTTYISSGDTVNISIKNGTSVTFVVSQAGSPEASREAKKQTVTLREVI